MPVLQSNSLKHLFLDDAFCMAVARHFFSFYFNINEYIINTSLGPMLLKNPLEDQLIRFEIDSGKSFDAWFMVNRPFEKSYLLHPDNSIKEEINFCEHQRHLSTGHFIIIARKKIATTKPLFLNALWHYRADTLIVEEIEIDNLSLDEIKKVTGEKKYWVAVVGGNGG